jgi:N-acetylmuramoyl-L-alanine amidase
MARTIFLSAGHGGTDPGAVANGYIERDLAIELRTLIATELKIKYGVEAKSDPSTNKLVQTLAWLKGKFGQKDILFDIHWNAGGGTGIEVIVPDASSNFERQLSQTIADRISAITTWKKRGGGVKKESDTPRKRLGWMRPNAENILIEVCFIDNKLDMAVYQANKVTIAKTIAQILYNFSKI